ncbi:MAG: helix-turn-helix domain-containing protein [Hyphomicrobiales bacterium]
MDQAHVGDLRPEDFTHLQTAFDLLPKVIFYVKDHNRLWVTCNKAALSLLRMSELSDVIGTGEEDFFPPAVAAAIKEDDLQIIENGECIVDRVEVITNEQGKLVWAMTSKIPIVNAEGIVLGIMGLTQILDVNAQLPAGFEKLKVAIKKIDESVEKMPTVPELAALADMSESHFRRSFKQCFGIAPQDFIMQQKLHHAAERLTTTDLSIAQIAVACGFGDQSYFIRQFGRFFGETPGKYRLKWQ